MKLIVLLSILALHYDGQHIVCDHFMVCAFVWCWHLNNVNIFWVFCIVILWSNLCHVVFVWMLAFLFLIMAVKNKTGLLWWKQAHLKCVEESSAYKHLSLESKGQTKEYRSSKEKIINGDKRWERIHPEPIWKVPSFGGHYPLMFRYWLRYDKASSTMET